jgi:hypothetical protein
MAQKAEGWLPLVTLVAGVLVVICEVAVGIALGWPLMGPLACAHLIFTAWAMNKLEQQPKKRVGSGEWRGLPVPPKPKPKPLIKAVIGDFGQRKRCLNCDKYSGMIVTVCSNCGHTRLVPAIVRRVKYSDGTYGYQHPDPPVKP